jgi:hypothetical protein
MKISVVYNRHEKPENSEYTEVHYSELQYLSDSTIKEIKIINTLDYVDLPEELISMAISKLRYGGKIIISGYDVYLIAQKILVGKLNINEIRKMLYNGRLNISEFENIKSLIAQLGLNIDLINLSIETNQYLIIARKPNVN